MKSCNTCKHNKSEWHESHKPVNRHGVNCTLNGKVVTRIGMTPVVCDCLEYEPDNYETTNLTEIGY